ncbi:hypothetical protein KAFR_0C03450 [Kazachstania africana CBS 2517]|uniref:Pheromone alpha factor receptor n=1 Tax=Kazachstania africana (strain ATCC 22294 / BCRC 22015 / CBS 2517 / CECT 1963 / NBRC 1671 / NRRL Y-8276) TaxID=1071382 RepID=H2ASI7_KAZAF|nr:hypothetical protein KAFR_0C03450 [Kazachstania africana CBS 2517]CCF57337.1 hypothetical protein KAFR_0C03450 [Kazachstania africana CBS 2517]
MSMADYNISSLVYDPSYDPTQSILLYTSIYGNDTAITFDYLNDIVNEKIREGILFGVRCGCATLTTIVMWLVSKKKKTPIFIINQISLILIIIHSGLYFKYLFSNSTSVTYYLTLFPQLVSRYDLNISNAASMFDVLLVACIECSLVFQIRIMFTGANNNIQKYSLMLIALSTLLGISTVGMLLTYAIKSIISSYNGSYVNPKYYNIGFILFSSSINFMTFTLVVKLLVAIRSRRYLGLKQFDSFHILLIMTCQSLLVPSIIVILAYSLSSTESTDVLITISTLLVVLSLPLSSMWASANNNMSTTTISNSYLSDYTQSDGTGFHPNDGDSNHSFQIRSSPRSEVTKIDDLEKNAFYELTRTKWQKSNSDSSDLDDSSLADDLYTPNTEADKDARNFWINENETIENINADTNSSGLNDPNP